MRKPHLGILIKPTSADCNLACDYCYYRPVEALYADCKRPRMALETVDEVCRQYRALEPTQIKIGWQGGEPTLMGLDFFRKVIQAETRHARRGDCWGNSLQTNGVLLNEEWCAFLAEHHFLVGLSVDGPPELNSMRKFPDGTPAYDVTMRALEHLRRHEVEFNILVVISQANVDQPEAVFRYLVENDLRFAQVIPCTEPAGGRALTEHSICGDEYARFMTRLFDAWVGNDDPGYYVRHIDNWLHLCLGLMPECCEYRQDCSNLVTIEWNGDVYPCDFFVEERFRMGNVMEQTLEQMIRGPEWREFTTSAEYQPQMCASCRWLALCNGGCYRHRGKLGLGPDDEPHLCKANQRIFEHVFGVLEDLKARPTRPRLHAFLRDLDRRVAAGEFGPRAAAPDMQQPAPAAPAGPPAGGGRAAGRSAPGRNAPCPCGSGRKFKACCGKGDRARR